jgi:hypothetical protein
MWPATLALLLRFPILRIPQYILSCLQFISSAHILVKISPSRIIRAFREGGGQADNALQ